MADANMVDSTMKVKLNAMYTYFMPDYTPARPIPLGIYRHYKGNRYEVLYVGLHSETLEELVVYRRVDAPEAIWIRPRAMFLETVQTENGEVLRFTKEIDEL